MWRDRLARRRFRINTTSENSRRFAKIAKIAFVGVVVSFLLLIALLPFLAFNLPSPDKIVRREGFSTKILDRNGEVLYDIFVDQKRTPASFSEIPDYLKQATIAIEDKNFYQHSGFDATGYLRALFNIVFRGKLQGGSTLTQQLVKKALLTDDRTLIRKINEFVITIQIEQKYSKDEILRMYLNEIPYGGTAWGVEAASETYFGKKVRDLNLVESAFMAGLPQRPSAYSPYSSTPKAYIGRTQAVLRRMREDGYITPEQENEASGQLSSLAFVPQDASFKAPHFVQYVKDILEERYGEQLVEQGGLRVTTTLDLSLQEKAQQIILDEITKAKSLGIGNGASVTIDPLNGDILSMVGSYDFKAKDYDGQVNVTTALRQPGSAIKPFTYATALKEGYSPSTLLIDAQTTFPGGVGQPDYKPENYDGKYRGPIQLRYALGNSINIPAVKMLAMVGVRDMLSTAYDMGISTLEPTRETLSRVGLSVTLGGGEVRLLELTGAYAPFMNKGIRHEPRAILEVRDQNGKILEKAKDEQGRQVISPEVAYLISHILSDNSAREIIFGLNSLLNIPGKSIAVKTGTTNDRRDNWAIGGNQFAVVGAWVGNNDNSPMKSVASGVSGATPIWRKILLAALENKPNEPFEVPEGINSMDIDSISGYPAHDGYPSRTEYFIRGTEPQSPDPNHVKMKVCKNEGKIATPSDVAGGNYDEKEYIVLKEEDPTAGAGQPNRWQEGILGWIATQTDGRYKPPTDFCGTPVPLNVEFRSPIDRTSNLPNTFTVKISAESTSEIAILDLEVDNSKIRSFSGLPYEHEVTLADGVHTLRARAIDSQGRESDRKITIGVNTAWDAAPAP